MAGYLGMHSKRLPPLEMGATFKLTALRPSGILQWEQDEMDFRYFSDASNHPAEGISQRHGGGNPTQEQIDVKGGASVGILDGSVRRITYREYYQIAGEFGHGIAVGPQIKRTVPAPNDLYYDPRDTYGGVVPVLDIDRL